ncbi:MAG: mechanosensitive ion channel [Bacteroidia bacterium]|nr:mechanosensitive ion channel [Bacteroidia bacterium]
MKRLMEFLSLVIFEHGDYKFTVGNLALIISIIGGSHLIYIGVRTILRRRFRNSGGKPEDEGKLYSIKRLIAYFLYSIAIIISLESSGIDVTLLVAGSTALLVGVGFGLQNTFNDLVSGIILLFEGSTQVNDIIEVGDLLGKVQRIGLRTSTVETQDMIVIIVPNSKLISENVINWSRTNSLTRFHVKMNVAYGSDMQLVRKTLLECATNHPEVTSEPAPFVWINDFGESGINVKLFYFSPNKFYHEKVKSDLRFSIDDAFRRNKIRIPFPQRDIHMHASQPKPAEEPTLSDRRT